MPRTQVRTPADTHHVGKRELPLRRLNAQLCFESRSWPLLVRLLPLLQGVHRQQVVFLPLPVVDVPHQVVGYQIALVCAIGSDVNLRKLK